MIKISNIIFLIFLTVNVFAAKPPVAVTKAFEEKFPTAAKVKWGKENKTEWEAEFLLGARKMSANFSIDGTLVETEGEIPLTMLPQNISDAVKKEIPDASIIHVDKVENMKKGTTYEVEVKTDNKKKEIIFMDDGTLVKNNK